MSLTKEHWVRENGVILTEGGEHIASVIEPETCWDDAIDSAANAEFEAIGDLIAAAPELLEACQRALPWIGKMIADGAHMHSVAPNDCVGAMEQMHAAIAKATGGDHA